MFGYRKIFKMSREESKLLTNLCNKITSIKLKRQSCVFDCLKK